MAAVVSGKYRNSGERRMCTLHWVAICMDCFVHEPVLLLQFINWLKK